MKLLIDHQTILRRLKSSLTSKNYAPPHPTPRQTILRLVKACFFRVHLLVHLFNVKLRAMKDYCYDNRFKIVFVMLLILYNFHYLIGFGLTAPPYAGASESELDPESPQLDNFEG